MPKVINTRFGTEFNISEENLAKARKFAPKAFTVVATARPTQETKAVLDAAKSASKDVEVKK